MKKWIIHGNKQLSGNVKIEGAKNSLVAILPAAILTKSIVELENVTPISDTYVLIDILKKLNVEVIYDNESKMIIDARFVKNARLISEDMRKLRASYYFMGALLGLYKKVSIIGPGGCKFSSRPIDLHLKAFKQLGVVYKYNDEVYVLEKKEVGEKSVVFEKVSVGATINAILASCRRKGTTIITNVAMEPEIDDLIEFLNKSGADIIRKDNKIIVKGKVNLHGCKHKIIQDRIEAGTFLVLGACVGKSLTIDYTEPEKLNSLINVLKNCGVPIIVEKGGIKVSSVETLNDSDLICDVYPGLPTDLQQPLSILLSKTRKKSSLKDNVYPSRYTQIDDLNVMGFNMQVENGALSVYRSESICGKQVFCKDLRGGASLILAGLLASGETVISNVYHIERGYYNLLNKLRKIGAIAYEED